MLTRGKDESTSVYGFLISAEISDANTESLIEALTHRFIDGPNFMEGIGKIEAECLGPLDIVEAIPTEAVSALIGVP